MEKFTHWPHSLVWVYYGIIKVDTEIYHLKQGVLVTSLAFWRNFVMEVAVDFNWNTAVTTLHQVLNLLQNQGYDLFIDIWSSRKVATSCWPIMMTRKWCYQREYLILLHQKVWCIFEVNVWKIGDFAITSFGSVFSIAAVILLIREIPFNKNRYPRK